MQGVRGKDGGRMREKGKVERGNGKVGSGRIDPELVRRQSLPGRIISFAYTTPAVKAAVKTVTRRDWSPEYAQQFRDGAWHQAYDKSPRCGGRFIRYIVQTSIALGVLEATPDMDFIEEGFEYLSTIYGGAEQIRKHLAPFADERLSALDVFRHWREMGRVKGTMLMVLRFRYPNDEELRGWLTEQTKNWSAFTRDLAFRKVGLKG